jgi:hypothetical protein
MILSLGGERTNGERVEDREADEEGAGKGRETIVSIEFSSLRFCRYVLRRETNTQETEDVSRWPEENRSRSTETMGKN